MIRKYTVISPQFWTGEMGKKIDQESSPEVQVIALYLLTAPTSNMIGQWLPEEAQLSEHYQVESLVHRPAELKSVPTTKATEIESPGVLQRSLPEILSRLLAHCIQVTRGKPQFTRS